MESDGQQLYVVRLRGPGRDPDRDLPAMMRRFVRWLFKQWKGKDRPQLWKHGGDW